MRRAGRLAAEALDMIGPYVQPGVTTERLDDLIREFTYDNGGVPACLGYRGYEKTTCISLNHVVCHGIPGPRALREGDILNIDHTVVVDGWHGDTSRMYAAGARQRPRAQAGRRHLRGAGAGAEGDPPGRPAGRHRLRDPDARREAPHERGDRLLRPRRRSDLPRRAQRPALRPARHGRGAAGGDVLHRRADGEPGQGGHQGAQRRLDGGDARQVAVGPVRAFGRA